MTQPVIDRYVIEIFVQHEEGPEVSTDAILRAICGEVAGQVRTILPPEGAVADLDKPDATYAVTGVKSVAFPVRTLPDWPDPEARASY